jgi:nucleoside-diphosphate-sugar epimerase
MNEIIMVTGASGAIGLPFISSLLRPEGKYRVIALIRPQMDLATMRQKILQLESTADFSRIEFCAGDITDRLKGLDKPSKSSPVSAIVHAAALTKFRAEASEWNRINVAGTKNILRWRQDHCPEAHFIHLSTLCAAGQSTGRIEEAPLPKPIGFQNGYECSKWEAEQIVMQAPGPVSIVRLATAIGSQRDGRLHRVGAFHQALRWFYRGLLPLVPGNALTQVELIPTELAIEAMTELLSSPRSMVTRFYHICGGANAIPLQALLDHCSQTFMRSSEAWRRGQIVPPVLATRDTFEEFRRSVEASRDLLFSQVLQSVDSFLPELFYPKEFATDHSQRLVASDTVMANWKQWMDKVITFSLQTDFGRLQPL